MGGGDERKESSAVLLPWFSFRAAARWVYVVTSDAGALGKPSTPLMCLTDEHTHAHKKFPGASVVEGLCYSLSFQVSCEEKNTCAGAQIVVSWLDR